MKYGLTLGALLGLLAVAFGAFGAHALKEILEPETIRSYETAVRFQMYHALVLLILGFAELKFQKQRFKPIILLFFVGTILFSFSIYSLCLDDAILKTSLSWMGPVTPLGGLILIIAWGALAWKSLAIARNSIN